jgi:hypothetical protein
MRTWNEVKILVCAACCIGATACSDDGDASTDSNLLQARGGSAGSGGAANAGGSAGSAGSGGAANGGGAANAGAPAAAGTAGTGAGAPGAAGTAGMGPMVEADAGAEPPDDQPPMMVGFSDVATILQDNCGDCHGMPGGFLPAFAQDDEAAAYEVTQQTSNNLDDLYSERIVVRAVVERTMPPACFGDDLGTDECLSEDEAALLEAWLAQGALP